MYPTVFPIFIALFTVLITFVFSSRFSYLKSCYYFGISSWSGWLPVIATSLYILILTANITVGDRLIYGLTLGNLFSVTEIIFLFFLGPLFLTRHGHFLALAVLTYCLGKFLTGNFYFSSTIGLNIVLGAATVVSVLGDRLPWNRQSRFNVSAKALREIILFLLTFGALIITLLAIFKAYSFTRWISNSFSIRLPLGIFISLMTIILMGWLSIAAGFGRNFLLPIISLPTLFALAYLTRWPSFVLVVPFAACLALSLTTAERRIIPRSGPTAAGFRI